jgi:phosphotransferase system  glucose/maltose/N-acetylglucosamine-specific IIC component
LWRDMHDLRLIWKFALHTIGAAALFALVGAAAALLHYYTEALATLHMPIAVLTAIRWTEYLLFAVDLVCFIIYVLRETWTLIRAMFVTEAAAPGEVITD